MKEKEIIKRERQQMYEIIDMLSFLQGFEVVETYTMIDKNWGKRGYDYKNLKECQEVLHNLGIIDNRGVDEYWKLVATYLD